MGANIYLPAAEANALPCLLCIRFWARSDLLCSIGACHLLQILHRVCNAALMSGHTDLALADVCEVYMCLAGVDVILCNVLWWI